MCGLRQSSLPKDRSQSSRDKPARVFWQACDRNYTHADHRGGGESNCRKPGPPEWKAARVSATGGRRQHKQSCIIKLLCSGSPHRRRFCDVIPCLRRLSETIPAHYDRHPPCLGKNCSRLICLPAPHAFESTLGTLFTAALWNQIRKPSRTIGTLGISPASA